MMMAFGQTIGVNHFWGEYTDRWSRPSLNREEEPVVNQRDLTTNFTHRLW
jgi:hypothetical protein